MDGELTTPRRGDAMLRLIGAVKLLKAALFLALGLALAQVLGDAAWQARIEDWVSQLRPGKLTHLVEALLDRTLSLPIGKRAVLVGGAFAYAAIFSVEGTGLLMRKRWAEWLAILSTGLLLPFEVYEIAHKPDATRVGAFAVNVAIVVYLIVRVRRDRTGR